MTEANRSSERAVGRAIAYGVALTLGAWEAAPFNLSTAGAASPLTQTTASGAGHQSGGARAA